MFEDIFGIVLRIGELDCIDEKPQGFEWEPLIILVTFCELIMEVN